MTMNQLADLKKQHEETQTRNQSLSQQLERMRSLVENLDQTKEELLKRLQNSTKET